MTPDHDWRTTSESVCRLRRLLVRVLLLFAAKRTGGNIACNLRTSQCVARRTGECKACDVTHTYMPDLIGGLHAFTRKCRQARTQARRHGRTHARTHCFYWLRAQRLTLVHIRKHMHVARTHIDAPVLIGDDHRDMIVHNRVRTKTHTRDSSRLR